MPGKKSEFFVIKWPTNHILNGVAMLYQRRCASWAMYYCKKRQFKPIGCVKKQKKGKSDKNNSYFSNLCSTAFTIFVFLILVIAAQSILSQCSHYGKTSFFISGTLRWHELKTFQRKITTTKHGSVFYLKIGRSNWCGRKKIKRSYNKTFKQVFSLFWNLISALFIFRVTIYTYLKFEGTVVELKKMLLQVFSDTPNWL